MIENKKIWLIGYGGIAKSIAEELSTNNKIIVYTSRKHDNSTGLDNIKFFVYKDYSENNIKDFIINHTSDSIPDYIIITCGKLYDKNNKPEKTITQFNNNWLLDNIDHNFLPHAYVAKHLTPKITKKSKLVMVCFSARVGSVTDNRLGGWHSYRISKTMLNMLVKNIAIEWKVKSPESIIFSYHPGTVDTNLSKPFQKSIDKDKIFNPKTAANHFIDVIDNINKDYSGLLYDWKGELVKF